jgi:hypothetical protein
VLLLLAVDAADRRAEAADQRAEAAERRAWDLELDRDHHQARADKLEAERRPWWAGADGH